MNARLTTRTLADTVSRKLSTSSYFRIFKQLMSRRPNLIVLMLENNVFITTSNVI